MCSVSADPGAISARRHETKAICDAFLDAVERVEKILDLENEQLSRHEMGGLRELNYEKSLGLLELTRTSQVLRARDGLAFDADAKQALARLRQKLDANIASLNIHMRAAGEIAAIIAQAIVEHESDGTYTAVAAAVRPAG
jgi:hypothetical protein